MSNDHPILVEKFHEGMHLASAGDHDRAHALFVECVSSDPGNVDFVAALLANLAHTPHPSGNIPAPTAEDQAALERAVADRNWVEVLELGQRLLPFARVPTMLFLAEANAAQGHGDVELCYLAKALEIAPNDVEVNRRNAQTLARMWKFDEALACWQRVQDLSPADSEAARSISLLAIEKSRRHVGMKSRSGEQAPAEEPRASAPPRSSPPKASPGFLFGERRVQREYSPPIAYSSDVKLTPIQQLEAAIRDNPANPEFYVHLTPLYLEKGRDYDAERMLAKGRQATDDPRVRQLWEDVTMLRLEKKITMAQERAEVDETSESREALAELITERDRLETEIFVNRCQREPNNSALRYELGMRLKRAGKIPEAQQRFREALHDKQQKCAAAYELGECLRQAGQLTEALQYYRMAAESASGPEQLDSKKQALYRAAGLAARIKLFRLAQRYLSELIQLDPQYREAGALMHSIQQHLG